MKVDFVVTVPGRLIDDKWQVQLTPVAYKRGRRIELERIFLSGADFAVFVWKKNAGDRW